MAIVRRIPNLAPELVGRFAVVCGHSIYPSHFDEHGNLLSMRKPDLDHTYGTEGQALEFAAECISRNGNAFNVALLELEVRS